ncbi:hypothetical protein HK096_001649, partial [Nowakowskiella sp. JEL0078]
MQDLLDEPLNMNPNYIPVRRVYRRPSELGIPDFPTINMSDRTAQQVLELPNNSPDRPSLPVSNLPKTSKYEFKELVQDVSVTLSKVFELDFSLPSKKINSEIQIGPAYFDLPNTWQLQNSSDWGIAGESAVFSRHAEGSNLSLSFFVIKNQAEASVSLQHWVERLANAVCSNDLEINMNVIDLKEENIKGCTKILILDRNRKTVEYRSFFSLMDYPTRTIIVAVYTGYPVAFFGRNMFITQQIIKNIRWNGKPKQSSEAQPSSEIINRSMPFNHQADNPNSESRIEDEVRNLTNMLGSANLTETLKTEIRAANDLINRMHSGSQYSGNQVQHVDCGFFRFKIENGWSSVIPESLVRLGVKAIVSPASELILIFPPRSPSQHSVSLIDTFINFFHQGLEVENLSDTIFMNTYATGVQLSQRKAVLLNSGVREYRVYSMIEIPTSSSLSSKQMAQMVLGLTIDNDSWGTLDQSLKRMVQNVELVPLNELEFSNSKILRTSETSRLPPHLPSHRKSTDPEILVSTMLSSVRPRDIADLFGLRRVYGRIEGVFIGSAVASSTQSSKPFGTDSTGFSGTVSSKFNLSTHSGGFSVSNDMIINNWIRLILIITNDGFVIERKIPKNGSLSRFYMDGTDSFSNGNGNAAECPWKPDQSEIGKYKLSLDNDDEKIMITWKTIAPEIEFSAGTLHEELETSLSGIPVMARRSPGSKSEGRIVDDDMIVFDHSQFLTVGDLRLVRATGFPLSRDNMMEIETVKSIEKLSNFQLPPIRNDYGQPLVGKFVNVEKSSFYLNFQHDGLLILSDSQILDQFNEEDRILAESGLWRFSISHFTLTITGAISSDRVEFSIVPVPLPTEITSNTSYQPIEEIYIDSVLYRKDTSN